MNFEDGAILHSSYTTTSFASDYFIKLTSADLNTRYFDEFYQASNELVIELATAIDIQDFALFKEKLSENQLCFWRIFQKVI